MGPRKGEEEWSGCMYVGLTVGNDGYFAASSGLRRLCANGQSLVGEPSLIF